MGLTIYTGALDQKVAAINTTVCHIGGMESLFMRKENEGATSLLEFIQIRIHIVSLKMDYEGYVK